MEALQSPSHPCGRVPAPRPQGQTCSGAEPVGRAWEQAWPLGQAVPPAGQAWVGAGAAREVAPPGTPSLALPPTTGFFLLSQKVKSQYSVEFHLHVPPPILY